MAGRLRNFGAGRGARRGERAATAATAAAAAAAAAPFLPLAARWRSEGALTMRWPAVHLGSRDGGGKAQQGAVTMGYCIA